MFSAGVGRTGTFIALDITLLRLNQLQEQTINIHDTVKELRDQRVNMVQTLVCYRLTGINSRESPSVLREPWG